MPDLRASVAAARAVLLADWLMFISYRTRFIAQSLSAFFSLTLFYYVSQLVRVEPFTSPGAYYAFAVIGLVILSVLNSTLGTPPMRVRQELLAGTFERLYLSPFGPVGSLISMLLFPFVYALLNAITMLVFAYAAFGMDVHWSTAPLAIPLSILGALSFMPFGVGLLAATLAFKQASSGTTWVVAGISLISGLYFPVTLLPDWIQWMSDVQPFTPATELLRHVLVDTPLTESAWLSLAKMIGFTVVLLPLSFRLVKVALNTGRRRGTIIEY